MKKIYLRQQQLDKVVEIMRQFELAKNGIKKKRLYYRQTCSRFNR